MAILKGIAANVQVNGHALQEYVDDDSNEEVNGHDNPTVITKYVEATSETSFTIKLVVAKSYKFTSNGVNLQVFVDGEYAAGALCRRDVPTDWRRVIEGAERTEKNVRMIRSFSFGEVELCENPPDPASGLADMERAKSLGTITIKAFRVSVGAKIEIPKDTRATSLFEEALTVTEKECKGRNLSHKVKYGKASPAISANILSCVYLDNSIPFAILNFNYRSRKALQGMLLIARTPSPVPLEERDVDQLNVEEARELLRRQQARNQLSAGNRVNDRVKPEPSIKSEHVKRERDDEYEQIMASAYTKRARSSTSTPGEIIDLD